jgi:hypothetical protein
LHGASIDKTQETVMSARKPSPPFPPQEIDPPGQESKMRPKPRFEAPGYRPASKLDGKVALITGGDSGIGRAVAVMFAREGADLALIYLHEEARDAKTTEQATREAGREALLLPGDVRDEAFCGKAVSAVLERFGRLDILVNNAAIQFHRASRTSRRGNGARRLRPTSFPTIT